MGIITTTNGKVLKYKGLHLYHAGISNCAMRVRVVLEEKKLQWTSHHIDILKKEHLTPEYFSINPKGLVPALVHDGVVIVESDDIIDYIDKTFPEPPLSPIDQSEREAMYGWMKLAVNNHIGAVKTYIYYNKIQKFMRQSEDEKKSYEKLQTNKNLSEFHKKNSSNDGISEEDAEKAKGILTDCFNKAEAILQNKDWLVGDNYSLADITWIPLHFTLHRSGFSFEEYPAIEEWAKRISERESFKKGVLEWWPGFSSPE